MNRIAIRWAGLGLLVGGMAVTLAACTSATPTGQLSLAVSGLPAGVSAAVKLAGSSFSKVVTTSSATTVSLPEGTYTVTPQAATLRRNVFDGTPASATVTVSAGSPASDTVAYAVRAGDAWIAQFNQGTVVEVPASQLSAHPPASTTTLGGASHPTGLAFDASGNLWVADASGTVVEYPASSLAATVHQTGTKITGLGAVNAVAFDAVGNLWVALGTSVVEYKAGSLSGSPTTGASITGLSGATALAFDASGNLWVALGSSVVEYMAGSLSGSQATGTTISGVTSPYGLAFDASGNLWVVDGGSGSGGSVSEYPKAQLSASAPSADTSIGPITAPQGLAFDDAGNLWVTDQAGTVTEYLAASLTGSHATGTTISLTDPVAVAFDPPPFDLPLSH